MPIVNGQVLTAEDLGGTWQTYAPTFTGFSLGSGTATGRWVRQGNTVTVEVSVTLGGTSSFSGVLGVSLPVASAGPATGAAFLVDQGTRFYAAVVRTPVASVTVGLTTSHDATSGAVNGTSPFTWTATDTFQFTLTYCAV